MVEYDQDANVAVAAFFCAETFTTAVGPQLKLTTQRGMPLFPIRHAPYRSKACPFIPIRYAL